MTVRRRWLCHLLIVLVVLGSSLWAAWSAEAQSARLTFYLPTGNPMASGIYPYSGAAACSYNWPMGSVLAFEDGREVVCLDRGMLGPSHVDVFVWSMEEGYGLVAQYGAYPNMETLRWGW